MKTKYLLIILISTLILFLFLAIPGLPNWSTLPEWMGLREKKSWDLAQICIIPIVLAVGAIIFSLYQHQTEMQIETERQRGTAFQSYIDRIKEIILEMHSMETGTDEITDEIFDEISEKLEDLGEIGAAYTKVTLQQLDGKRKGMLLEFLYNSHLLGWFDVILGEQFLQIIYLGESADFNGVIINTPALRGVNLGFTNLSNSNFIGLDLCKAHLLGSNFSNSKFIGVNFFGADLGGANFQNVKWGIGNLLEQADLRSANLRNADMRKANLDKANLEFAKYNRKTKLPKGFDPLKAKMVLVNDRNAI
jgi:uncharacterized protein YjbI with pentapeptide repeats